MAQVAVGWQVYAIHHSAFDLGLIGLAEFVPLPILALPAGHLADRFSRRAVFAASLALSVAVTVGLLVVSFTASEVLWPFLVLAAAAGVPALGVDTLLAGFRFMRRTPVLLGAITLDLFAVLFGGAVALLPLFARSVLHTGPFGLGVLRTAPAVGALLAGVVLTRRPL